MRGLALFAIGLVFGGGIGFLLAASSGVTLDGHDHSDPAQHVDGHGAAHDTPLDIPAATAPTIAIEVRTDPKSGHSLQVMTERFRFAPESASGAHKDGEGHAHVYVNGHKLTRLYGDWLFLGDLPAGEATIEVTLNSNDHRVLTVDGQPISASTTVVVD